MSVSLVVHALAALVRTLTLELHGVHSAVVRTNTSISSSSHWLCDPASHVFVYPPCWRLRARGAMAAFVCEKRSIACRAGANVHDLPYTQTAPDRQADTHTHTHSHTQRQRDRQADTHTHIHSAPTHENDDGLVLPVLQLLTILTSPLPKRGQALMCPYCALPSDVTESVRSNPPASVMRNRNVSMFEM